MGPSRNLFGTPKHSIASISHFKRPSLQSVASNNPSLLSIISKLTTPRNALLTENKCLPTESNNQLSRRQAVSYNIQILLFCKSMSSIDLLTITSLRNHHSDFNHFFTDDFHR